MQQAKQLSPTRVQAGAPAKSGPVALHPHELKLVSGGSPRGGWIIVADSSLVADAKIESPRGGW